MNCKRAAWMSVLLYLASFIVGIILAIIVGYDFATATEPTTSFWIAGVLMTIVLAALFTWWYFKKVKANAKNGLFFGLVAMGVGFIFDALVLIPTAIVNRSFADILKYYASPFFYITIVAMLLTTSGVGWYLEKKK